MREERRKNQCRGQRVVTAVDIQVLVTLVFL